MRKVLKRDSTVLAVLRPKDPALALKLAKAALGRKDGEAAMQEILAAQEYTFVGLPSEDGKTLLDPSTYEPIGDIEMGDSFVSWESLQHALGKKN